jgi:hypothetical protein
MVLGIIVTCGIVGAFLRVCWDKDSSTLLLASFTLLRLY